MRDLRIMARLYSGPAMSMRWKRALLVVAIGSALSASQSTGAEADFPTRFPAAGVALEPLLVRLHPDTSSRVARRLPRFRADHQFQIVLALSSRRRANGTRWYLLSLPGPPNGAQGWVPADAVDVRPVTNRIIVRLASRRIEVRRAADGKLLLQSAAAIGRPGAETPLGRNFYVQSAFVPTDPFYGALALETSASSGLSDWPDNGIVGIHGTNRPELLGQAVSHGCIRVDNGVARRLGRLAPLGTPIDIVP
jgi:L,D-transpeptidase catalytic domain